MHKGKSLLSVKETRKRLGNIGHTKVYELFASGRLTPLKLDGRTFVADDEVGQLIESLQSGIEAGTIRPLSGAAQSKQVP